MQAFFSRQFVLFLVTGGTAALVNFLSRILYSQWVTYSFAIVIAYATGMITAFVLVKRFVFKNSTRRLSQSAAIFAAVNLLAVAQVWSVSMVFAVFVLPGIGWDEHAEEIAHAVGLTIPVFTSYLGHKYWSFR